MGLDYFVFYCEANIVCILIVLVMLINDRIHTTQQEKQVWFNRTIIAHILYFISDIGWAAVLGNQLPRTRLLVAFFNLSNYFLLSLLAYEWFMYMAASEKMPFRKNRKKRLLCLLPMALSFLIMVAAYAADPLFWIDEGGELSVWYYPLFIAAPVFYLLLAFIFSIINAGKTDNREDRKQYWLIGIYPLGVMAFGLFQTFSLNAPLFCFGCTFMMLCFYIQHMQALISVDALTRLNNRGQINRYMDQAVYRENAQTFVLMIDIDRFKEINDTYGHAEGDRALILVSEALKKACEHIKGSVFLGRYGGDEFTVFIQNQEKDASPEQAESAIRGALAEKRQENMLPYDLEVSVGYAVLRDKNDSMQACVIRADEMLYNDKRARGAGR